MHAKPIEKKSNNLFFHFSSKKLIFKSILISGGVFAYEFLIKTLG